MRSLFLTVFAFVLCCASTSVSRAQQQPPTIEFDKVVFDATSLSFTGGGLTTFTNSDTSVISRLQDGRLGPSECICLSGNVLDLRSGYGGETSITGGRPGTVNGIAYNAVYFSGRVQINSNNIRIPHTYNRAKFLLTVPVTLTGTLNIHDRNPFTGNALVIAQSTLNLAGTAVVTLKPNGYSDFPDGNGGFRQSFKIFKIKYDFERGAQSSAAEFNENKIVEQN